MKKLITVGATVVAVALMTPAGGGANHVAGATYDGTVNTGTGGTVSFTVSADGTTVDFTATGFGQTGCEGATMGVEDVPITDHSFFFSASSPTRSVSGSFPTPGSASGSVRLSFACDSGFQSWTAEASVAAADATIARSTDSAATGIDVFNTTGADQTRTWGVKRGKTRSFDVVVENAGSDTGRIDIKGCGSSRGFKVRYESLSGANITPAVLAGTFGQMRNPGASVFASMIIKATNDARVGKTKVCKATGISEANNDVVKAELKVKPG